MKKNSTFKRFLAFLLCAAMMITYMPSSVYTLADANADGPQAISQEAPKTEESAPAETGEKTEEPSKDAETPKEETKEEAAPEKEEPAQTEPAKDTSAEEPAKADKPSEEAGAADEQAVEPEQGAEEEATEPEQAKEEPEEDEAYPAQHFEESTFGLDSVKVIVDAPKGALPAGTTMKVRNVAKSTVSGAIKEEFGEETKIIKAVDVTFYNAKGEEIQPEQNISVSFESTKFKKLENPSVVHIDDEGAASKLDGDLVSTEGKKVDFETQEFSIYVVTDETKLITVNFYDEDGSFIASQYIKENSDGTIQDLHSEDAHLEYGERFVGWATEKGAAISDAMNLDQLNAQFKDGWTGYTNDMPVNYYAILEKVYVVQFIRINSDTSQVVVKSEAVSVDADEADRKIIIPDELEQIPSADFQGWISESGETYSAGYEYTVNNHENFYLKEAGHTWLIFDANAGGPGSGATYTPPQLIYGEGVVTVEPPDPTRTGYIFKGWNTHADGSGDTWTSESFGDTIEQDVILYAQWEGAETTYNVLYWQQDVSDEANLPDDQKTYTYVGGRSATAKTGDEVSTTSEDTGKAGSDGYKHYIYNANHSDTTTTVAADGTTVLNVYYDLEQYTLKFQVENPYVKSDSTESGNYYIPNESGGYTGPIALTREGDHWTYETEGTYSYVLTESTSSGNYYYRPYPDYYPDYYIETYLYRYNNRWYRNRNGNYYYNEVSEAYERVYTPGETVTYSGDVFIRGSGWTTIKEITALYGHNISGEFPIHGLDGKEYPTGTRWNPQIDMNVDDTQYFTHDVVVAYIDVMPPGNMTFHYSTSNNSEKTMVYWIECLDGIATPGKRTDTFEGVLYEEYKTVKAKYYGVTVEDYISLPGFTKNKADQPLNYTHNGTTYYGNGSAAGTVNFYYTRKTHTLHFISVSEGFQPHDVTGIPYQKKLTDQAVYVPTNGKDGFAFVGWYTDENCAEGTEFDFDSTMPDKDVTLYAKWETQRCRVVLNPNAPEGTYSFANNQALKFHIDYNEKLSDANIKPNTSNRVGYVLDGWYVEGTEYDGELWTFNAQVNESSHGVNMNYQNIDEWHQYGDDDGEHNNVKALLKLKAHWLLDVKENSVYVIYKVGDAYLTHDADGNVETITPVDTNDYLINTGSDSINFTTKEAPSHYDPNYDFHQWAVLNKDGVKTGNSFNAESFASVDSSCFKTETVTDDAGNTATMKYVVLEAEFEPKGNKATAVVFDGNGGKTSDGKTTKEESYVVNEQFTILPANTFTKAGYDFKEWNTAQNGTGEGATVFEAGTTVAADNLVGAAWDDDSNKNIVYAQWTPRDDTPYTVEYYYMEDDGTYPETASVTDPRTGTTDTTVSVTDADKTPTQNGYALDDSATDKLYSGSIAGDGSLVLKVFFKKQFTVTYQKGTKGTFDDIVFTGQDYGVMPQQPQQSQLTHADGYTFNGWDPEVTTVTGNATYVAKWTANTDTPYKVEYYLQNLEDDDFTLDTEATENLTGTTDTTAEATIKTFTGFTFDEDNADNKLSGIITGDGQLVLKVYYTRDSYKVSYAYTGTVPTGASELPADATYKYGASVTVADDATAPGYTFSGWSKEDFTMPAEDVEITGSFTANTDTPYKVEHYQQTADGLGYVLHETEDLTGTTDTEATAKPKTYTGFAFDADNAKNVLKGTITGDGQLVLKVYYNRKIYKVTYKYLNTPAGASALPAEATYRFGEAVKVAPNATAPGYEFSGWSTGDFTMPAEDVEITGSFTAKGDTPYKVEHYKQNLDGTYPANASETENLKGQSDTEATANPKTYEGFTFDAKVEGTVQKGNIAGDGSLVLKLYYTRNSYTVSYAYTGTVPEGAPAVPETKSYKFEETVPAAAVPTLVGYTFTGWTGEVAKMPARNVEVTGSWTANEDTKYTVAFFYQVGGVYKATPDSTVERAGTTDSTVSVTDNDKKPTKDEYVLDSTKADDWTGVVAGDGSLVLKVYFKQQFTVEFKPGLHGTFLVKTVANLDYGTKTPPAPEATGEAGYTFAGWINDATGAVEDIAATVIENLSYTAKWDANEDTKYTVEYYYQADGAYPAKATSSVERTGTTDTTASVTDADKTPTQDGYVFDEAAANVLSGNIAGDGSLVLKVYFKQQFTVEYKKGDHGTFTETKTENLDYGAATPAAPEATGEAGYTFTGWAPEVADTVTADATYVAQWAADPDATYSVKYIAVNGSVSVDKNENIQVLSTEGITGSTASPKAETGYMFDGWYKGGTKITDNLVLSEKDAVSNLNKGEGATYADTEYKAVFKRSLLVVTKETTGEKPENGYALGRTINYSIVVTNAGEVTISDITITDELTKDNWSIDSLEAGASKTFTTSYVVTEEDVLAGSVVKEATATGKDPQGKDPTVDPGEDPEPTDKPNGHLTVDKETTSTPKNGETYALGEKITYKITVKNDGNLTITDIKVNDDLTGDKWTIKSLAPNTSEEFTAEYTVTEADVLAGEVLNVATATGKSPDPEKPDVPVTPGEDPEPTDDPNGHLKIDKVTTSTPENGKTYALGEKITYKITVKNDGNLTIKDIEVKDELTGDSWKLASLEPGNIKEYKAEYTLTEADILKGEVLNVATATGKSPDPDEPDVPVDPGKDPEPTDDPAPSVDVEKSSNKVDGKDVPAGSDLTYTVKVTNTGNVTLNQITLTDDHGNPTDYATTLVPGESMTVDYNYTVTEADDNAGKVTNTVKGEGTDPNGRKVDDTDSITTIVGHKNMNRSPDPKDEGEKMDADGKGITVMYDGRPHEVSAETTKPGNTIYYSTDGGQTWSEEAPSRVDVGVTTFDIKATNPDYEDVVKTGYKMTVTKRPITLTSASAEKPYDGTPLVRNDPDTDITIGGEGLAKTDTLTFDITGSQTYVGTSPNTFTYEFGKRTTPGSIFKGLFSAAGPKAPLADDTSIADNYKVTVEYGDLTVTDDTDDENVITKIHEDKKFKVGDTITFTIKVTNIYDEPKTITIEEQAGVSITGASIFEDVQPGETVTTTATHKVTEADVKAGKFHNTATASFDGEDKTFNGDDEVTRIVATPSEGGEPNTGDNGYGFDLTMMFGSAAAFLAMLFGRRRREQE